MRRETNAALARLALQYPELLKPPVCPKPLQDFDESGLQCPPENTPDSASVGPTGGKTKP
jgi:hypothetical protein